MDVLDVGNTLSVGGLGVLRDGAAQVTVRRGGVLVPVWKEAQLRTSYSIGQSSPMTRVDVSGSSGLPLVADLVRHPKTQVMIRTSGAWRYIVTCGPQSLNSDALGMALFFRADEGQYSGEAGGIDFVTSSGAAVRYGVLATREENSLGFTTIEAFRSDLDLAANEIEAGASELFP